MRVAVLALYAGLTLGGAGVAFMAVPVMAAGAACLVVAIGAAIVHLVRAHPPG